MKTTSVNVTVPLSITYELADMSIDLDCKVNALVHPGDPGCYRTPNGDGWPASGPEVDVLDIAIADTDCDGNQVVVSQEMRTWCLSYLNADGYERLLDAACEAANEKCQRCDD
jgi:hypothetical protein